ncbi:Restriction endonuclease S subunit (HsdS) [Fructobacillus fructosus]|uniref:Restriction endonuclease S subunit (HsdS) n=1 Tax=Fructobacillus fructosus TaxID=1631 RepID=A0ABN9YYZ7_9LACO|nr:Restriction endonuclease S subunit (HsdS) [Fructobacillus fructosus]
MPKVGATVFKNVISVSANGANTGAMFYQTHPFTVLQDAYVIDLIDKSKASDMAYLYLVGALQKSIRFNFSWTNKAGWERIKGEKITLPVDKNGLLAFDYMEAYIKELEAERIKELEAYLVATGLNDYVLSAEEAKVLDNFKNGNSMWGEFSIGELFKVTTSKKRFDANKVTIQEKGYPYIARTSLNNGVRGYIKEDTKYLNEANTISFGQDTATMFYQEEQYFTGDKIKILTPEFDEFDEIIAQFFITSMSKSFSTFTWGSSSYNMKIINSQKIRIFAYPDGQPDYERMHVLIRSLEKLVIKGVVEWKNKQIKATRDVVNSD